jgi:hypothetical protein
MKVKHFYLKKQDSKRRYEPVLWKKVERAMPDEEDDPDDEETEDSRLSNEVDRSKRRELLVLIEEIGLPIMHDYFNDISMLREAVKQELGVYSTQSFLEQ